jgi:hypothetical protein
MWVMSWKSHTDVAAIPNTATNGAQNFDEAKFFSQSVFTFTATGSE